MKFQDIPVVLQLDLDKVPEGTIQHYWIDLVANGIAQSIYVPAIVAKGKKPGPVLGLTAVVHGNELNGLSIIQRLFKQLNVDEISGTVVSIPVVNVPSILSHERRFIDGEDLNRIMPGKADGNRSEVYAHRIIDRIIQHFDFLIDLHTASFGRVNSYYIRANMASPVTREMALLQNAPIILNNEGKDGTLRSAASDLGIDSITVEVGDPNKFQQGMIRSGLTGIFNVLSHLEMIKDPIETPDITPVICKGSYWLYADRGGILEVVPGINEPVYAGNKIAVVKDVFGHPIKVYLAPEDGIVIGKSVQPINQTGGRILHLGLVKSGQKVAIQ